MTDKAELVVIGGGPGGYAAAFYAADLGMKVTLVEKAENPGGVCLYRGCIPSKALLHVAKLLHETKEAKNWGITFSEPEIDLDKLRDWKNSVVQKLTGGLGGLVKQRKINYIRGTATFKDSNTLLIETQNGEEELSFEKAILATGSRPAMIPNLPESDDILDSTSGLELPEIPERLLVIGGGYIGLEMGTVYHGLGSKVTVVEMTPGLMPGADRDLVDFLYKRLKKDFDEILLETKVAKVEKAKKGLTVTFETKDGKSREEMFDKVLVSVGRKPNTSGLGLENTGINLTDRNFVVVDEQRKTDDDSIYAIGDITGDPMLAHKASHEGRTAVEAIHGDKGAAFAPLAIPAVIFTDPEIAWAGLTETEAKDQNRDVKVAKFPWAASGRATSMDRSDGVTKIVVDPEDERILGVGICGPGAGELIGEAVVAIEMGAVVDDLKLCIHAHPTLSETIMEAAEVFFGHATHIYRPKR